MATDSPNLRQLLVDYFSYGELRDVCFDLKVDYEALPGESKGDVARELLVYLRHRGRIQELVEYVKEKRPGLLWDAAYAAIKDIPSEQFEIEVLGSNQWKPWKILHHGLQEMLVTLRSLRTSKGNIGTKPAWRSFKGQAEDLVSFINGNPYIRRLAEQRGILRRKEGLLDLLRKLEQAIQEQNNKEARKLLALFYDDCFDLLHIVDKLMLSA